MSSPVIMAFAALSLLAAASGPATASPTDPNPLAGFQWKARVLVVVATDATDTRLKRQRDLFRAMRHDADDRQLVFLEAIGATPKATALRKHFDLGDGFHAVLVGKDGGNKLRSAEPVGPDQLFPLIDAMPMRQDEMRKS